MYNNLRFFNGTKSELQLVQDENNIWTGSIYLPEVSAALYETVNLFILLHLCLTLWQLSSFRFIFVTFIFSAGAVVRLTGEYSYPGTG